MIVDESVIQIIKKFKGCQETTPVNFTRLILAASPTYNPTDVFQAADLIQKCLKWVPSDRTNADACINHPFLASHLKFRHVPLNSI